MKIDELKKTIAKLEANLVAASNKATALQTERRKISFRAHSGDAEARTALDEVTAASTTAALEIENLKFSIEEAKRLIAEAEREEKLREERDRARKGKSVIARAGKRGPKMQVALKSLCEELSGFSNDLQELHVLGAPATTGRLIELAFEPSIAHPLRATGVVRIDIVPPGLRSQLADLVSTYLIPQTRWAAAVLGESVSADVAEVA
jgi:hypothetical protein